MAAPAPQAVHVATNSCTLIELLVVIAVYDSSGRLVQTVTTDRSGRFTLKNLTPGPYRLTISGESLTGAVGASGLGDQPGVIAVLIGLLLPAGRVEPMSSDQLPLTARRSGGGGGAGKVSFQDISFTKVFTGPAGFSQSPVNGLGGQGGGRYTFNYQGSVSLQTR
ncbi:carboxypeptidase-like regulatory domain-containing protein [Phenylobacterium sp.]|uniref:carboxypeptidase-like regulatory domain-containing protein n=1 Tax=Phenylobacterium sp. TaxID=1871053 RepID=UPI003BAD0140